MTKNEAMKMAWDALMAAYNLEANMQELGKAIDALRTALAQPEPKQEPVGYWMGAFHDGAATLYEVPQESAFARKYRNIPLFLAPSQQSKQSKQEPVAWQYKTNFYMHDKDDGTRLTYSLGVAEVNAQLGSIEPLYTAPPQRKPLSDVTKD